MSGHMGKERELLAKRRMLEQDAHKKYDELDVIFQKIVETDKKIEEQREKQYIYDVNYHPEIDEKEREQ